MPDAFALCLAGRPSGPDFYVAARGAAPPADPADADPCFATVVGHRGPRLVLLFFKFALPRSESRAARLGADGRDLEPTTRHVWIDEGGMPVACLRLLAEPDGSHRISRVATAADQRHQGLAGLLVDHVMATTPGRLVLDAQTYLEPWYVEHGFARTGDEFTDDGIPHVPMERG